LVIEPGFGCYPIARHGCGRNVESLAGLFNGQAAEKAQLNHARLLRIELGQSTERIVQRDDVELLSLRQAEGLIEREPGPTAAAFGSVALACVVHQNAPHHARGDGEEMGPVPPLDALLLYQAQIGFVHQGRTLQRVPMVLRCQVVARDDTQFVVDQGHEAVECAFVTLAPSDQQIRNTRQLPLLC